MNPYSKTPDDCILAYIAGYCPATRGRAAFALTIRRIEDGQEVEKTTFAMASDNTTALERAVAGLVLLLQCVEPCEPLPVIIRSGLEYPLKGVTEWLPDWKRRGWKTSSKKPVTSLEHWREIDALLENFERRSFSYQWVPPSANDALNAEAIELTRKKVMA
jgi:ribonuclease HI